MTDTLEALKITRGILLKSVVDIETQIAEIEKPDPYAELKAEHAAGKRIACRYINDTDDSWDITFNPTWSKNVEYKIIEDEYQQLHNVTVFGQFYDVRLIKDGLTGAITVELESPDM